MGKLGWVMSPLLLAGCVPPGPGGYGPGGYGAAGYGGATPSGYYAQAYPPGYGYDRQPVLIPLPEDVPRAARPAARKPAATTPAAPLLTARAPAPVPGDAAAAETAAAAGPECRTVTQVGYADGKEVQRQERFCRAAPGKDWVRS